MSLGHITNQEDFTEGIPNYLTRLDIACGNNKREGFKGIDIGIGTQADIVADLNIYPWDIENESCFELNCSHFIEHVKNIKSFMEECYRILIPKGTMRIAAPYYTAIGAWQDFTHVRAISENTFLYFSQDWLKTAGLEHYDINCNFKVESTRYFFNPEWATRSEEAKEWARKHYHNAVLDIEVILRRL